MLNLDLAKRRFEDYFIENQLLLNRQMTILNLAIAKHPYLRIRSLKDLKKYISKY